MYHHLSSILQGSKLENICTTIQVRLYNKCIITSRERLSSGNRKNTRGTDRGRGGKQLFNIEFNVTSMNRRIADKYKSHDQILKLENSLFRKHARRPQCGKRLMSE